MKTRRILFYLFSFLFVLIAPILIAFSLGYTINFKTAQLEKTGGIFVKSKMTRLSIFLDGAFQKETSLLSGGAILTELTPRMYLLRIEKEHYEPWFKTVQVQESLVNEYRNILLIPQDPFLSSATTTKEEIASVTPATSTPFKNLILDKKNNLLANGKIIARNIHVFYPADDVIYIIDKNGFLGRYHADTGGIDVLGHPGFYLANRNFVFTSSPQGDMAILDPSGGFFLLTGDTLDVIGGSVKKTVFDKTGSKILILKDQEISIRWIADNPLQPFEKAGTAETIMKGNNEMLDAAWYYDTNAHIVMRTESGVFITEIDGRGGRNTNELVSGKTEKLFTSLLSPRAVFYRQGKTWFKIEL